MMYLRWRGGGELTFETKHKEIVDGVKENNFYSLVHILAKNKKNLLP